MASTREERPRCERRTNCASGTMNFSNKRKWPQGLQLEWWDNSVILIRHWRYMEWWQKVIPFFKKKMNLESSLNLLPLENRAWNDDSSADALFGRKWRYREGGQRRLLAREVILLPNGMPCQQRALNANTVHPFSSQEIPFWLSGKKQICFRLVCL